tara:strand:+ start:1606 stop:2379 length:774 start_codon:yes stop_codon:yes gene_type:complete
MKNLLIASFMLLSFSFSAQVEKNPKKDKGTSTQVSTKNPASSSKAAVGSSTQSNIYSDKKPSSSKPTKPTSTKPSKGKGDVNRPSGPSNMNPGNSTGKERPAVKGSASSPSKPVSNSRAAAGSSPQINNYSDKKPTKPTSTKPTKGKGDLNRPSGSSNMNPGNSTGKERPAVKGSTTSPSQSASNRRAGDMNSNTGAVKSNSSEFCKGWEDGYVKGWNLNKKTPEKPNVPPCALSKTCSDYKCGYKMGMKKAESSKR